MPDALMGELNGIALWKLPLAIIAAGLAGYLLTRYGGTE